MGYFLKMHEFSIIKNILELVEEAALKNNLKSVSRVVLKVGELRQIDSDYLKFAFESSTKNSIAEDAELIVEKVPIKFHCDHCQFDFTVENQMFACSACGGESVHLISGKEIFLERIEGEPAIGN